MPRTDCLIRGEPLHSLHTATSCCSQHAPVTWAGATPACTLTPQPWQDDIAEEVELLDQVTSGITTLMAKYGDDGMALLEGLMPFFGQLLDPARSASERRVGICVLDDIIEHSSAGGALGPGVLCAEDGDVVAHTGSCWMGLDNPGERSSKLRYLVEGQTTMLRNLERCNSSGSCTMTCQDVFGSQPCVPMLA